MRWLFLWMMGCAAFADADPAERCAHEGPVAHDLIELGRIAWRRDLAEARSEARRTGLPILLMFNEVPGCSTVQRYGREVLSDPIVGEALHHEVVPLLVRNNVDGWERELLDRFGEPAWNNPVARVVDADLKPLGPRVTERTSAALLGAIADAKGETAARWLTLIAEEQRALIPGSMTFLTACFWDGEADLGAIDGVVATETGFQGGREVVRVSYDDSRLTRSELTRIAGREGHQPVSAGAFSASKKDDRWYLRHSDWAGIEMSPAQASRVNAAIRDREDPRPWLTPAQVAQHDRPPR